MRNIIFDLLGLTGLGLFCSGVYLKYGLDNALIVSGALILFLVIWAVRGKR